MYRGWLKVSIESLWNIMCDNISIKFNGYNKSLDLFEIEINEENMLKLDKYWDKAYWGLEKENDT